MANVENPYQITLGANNLVVTSGIDLNNSIFVVFATRPADRPFDFNDYNSETNEYFIGYPFDFADEDGNIIDLDNFNITFKMNNETVPSRKTEDGYYITTSFESMRLDIEIEDPSKTYFFNEDPDTGEKEYSTSTGFNFIPVSVEIHIDDISKRYGEDDPVYTYWFVPEEADQFMDITVYRPGEGFDENPGTYLINGVSVTVMPQFITYTVVPGELTIY